MESEAVNKSSCASFAGKRVSHLPCESESNENFVNFEQYIQEKCKGNIKLLDRTTFHRIKRPIVICFNHFRERCSYHTQTLDKIYQVTLIYGDKIEFIAADQMDMNVMYPNTNPIEFFCCLVRPENDGPNVYAIDEKKQVYQLFDASYKVETLIELCDNLLSGKLYISQSIAERSDTLVKVCVHENFDDIVIKSNRDILLIVGMDKYCPIPDEREPDYEQIAQDFKDTNVDIIYINGVKNYIPFEYHANSFPTLLFVPHNNKKQFINYSRGTRDTKNVKDFIKENLGSKGEIWRQYELEKLKYKPFEIDTDKEFKLTDLDEYVKVNFPESFTVLDRNSLHKINKCIIIHFMDIKGKGVRFYIETLQKVYQVAVSKYSYGVEYLIADLSDMDIIYPKWYNQYLAVERNETDSVKVIALDCLKRTYTTDSFSTAATLFYYSFNLMYCHLYYSEPLPKCKHLHKLNTCVADNMSTIIAISKIDMLLTVYWATSNSSSDIVKALDEIPSEIDTINVKLLKINAKYNYVPLEYSTQSYPVCFFIPHRDKDNGTVRDFCGGGNKEEIIKFIKNNVQQQMEII